jgi:hypothetical protein
LVLATTTPRSPMFLMSIPVSMIISSFSSS